MNKVVKLSADEERMEAANLWLLRVDEGLRESDKAVLESWLSADERNVEMFIEAARVWDETASLSRLAELFPQPRRESRFRPRFAVAGAAAALVVSVGAFLIYGQLAGGIDLRQSQIVSRAPQHFETAIGEQSTVVLPDGTSVVLNTNSQLVVSYMRKARVLYLVRGEMHVDVVEDPRRPLSVVAGNRIMQAVGTAFSVEITEDQRVDLIVTEGTVVVGLRGPGDRDDAAPPPLVRSMNNTVMAGETLIMGGDDELIVPVSEEEIEVKLAWREGSLKFSSEPLEKALAEMERYTTVRFVFLDEDLKTQSVSGRFRAGDVEALLIALRMNFNIAHEFDDDGRVLLSSL